MTNIELLDSFWSTLLSLHLIIRLANEWESGEISIARANIDQIDIARACDWTIVAVWLSRMQYSDVFSQTRVIGRLEFWRGGRKRDRMERTSYLFFAFSHLLPNNRQFEWRIKWTMIILVRSNLLMVLIDCNVECRQVTRVRWSPRQWMMSECRWINSCFRRLNVDFRLTLNRDRRLEDDKAIRYVRQLLPSDKWNCLSSLLPMRNGFDQ